jgi:cytochrome c553
MLVPVARITALPFLIFLRAAVTLLQAEAGREMSQPIDVSALVVCAQCHILSYPHS